MTGAVADTECVLQIVLGAAFAPSTTLNTCQIPMLPG
jgi:hypothetical protein